MLQWQGFIQDFPSYRIIFLKREGGGGGNANSMFQQLCIHLFPEQTHFSHAIWGDF